MAGAAMKAVLLLTNFSGKLPNMSELAADFQELQSLLDSVGSLVAAPECHGILSGYACSGKAFNSRDVLPHLLVGEVETIQLEQLDLELQRNMREILLQLEDQNLGFRLLLPDDEQPLTERVEALGQWCQGFLFGVGLGGLRNSEGRTEGLGEVLSDLTEIAQAGDYEIDAEEEDEFAYMELVEHVRTGAMLIYEEMREGEEPRAPSRLH